MKRAYLLAAGLSLALSAPALADVQIIQGQLPGNLETVQLDGADIGTTVFGSVNPDDTVVVLGSGEGINAPANGQARIRADDGNLGTLVISLQDLSLGFTRAELTVTAYRSGSVSIVAYDQFGTAFGTGIDGGLAYNVSSSGQNFFNFTTTNDQFITRIELTSNTAGISDIRQIRLNGVAEFDTGGPGTAVPEPGAWALMIAGFGGAGAMLRRRKAKLAVA